MLDTSREYVWFLSNVEVRPIKKQPTLICDWTCKEADVKVREYLRVCEPFEGCRLYSTMKALGWNEQENPNTTPHEFFFKGLHIRAKPLMYWSELNSEDMKWKLNYESLRPMNEQSVTLSSEDMKTLERICSARTGRDEVLAFMATRYVELIEPFLALYKEGKIKFKE